MTVYFTSTLILIRLKQWTNKTSEQLQTSEAYLTYTEMTLRL